MTIIFEFSSPIQLRPSLYKSRITTRFTWLFFAIAVHKMRYDEIIKGANKGEITWEQ